MSKHVMLGLIAALAVLLVVAGCSKSEPAAPAQSAPAPAAQPAASPVAQPAPVPDASAPKINEMVSIPSDQKSAAPAPAVPAGEDLVSDSDVDVGDGLDTGLFDESVADVLPAGETA